MCNYIYNCDHSVYNGILEARGYHDNDIKRDMPLWKLKISDDEYNGLKKTLRDNESSLSRYGIEAAIYYAEWWRREYNGGISKEAVANSIGIDCSEDLFKAACKALETRKYTFLHSLKRTEYFRTLLSQGGLPVNHIRNNKTNFTNFLKGLVEEMSIINYDWNNNDSSIIKNFNCISYLGETFKNDNIYDVAMKIAHAIIENDDTLLPYDDTDQTLSDLTKTLKSARKKVMAMQRLRPFTLHWKLKTATDGQGYMFINLDVVKDISSNSIPGLDISTCYSFDVFVAGTLASKYVRKSIDENSAIYTRISVGPNKDVLWRGESVVEVKIRCDNDQRLFLTIVGCYPPNFEYPQVFQMLDDNIYSNRETAKSENNIAIFTSDWKQKDSQPITIAGQELYYNTFSQNLNLQNIVSRETVNLTNKFTTYSAEFSGNYITWVEKSNYKILSGLPTIHVYDNNNNLVQRCHIQYRARYGYANNWRDLNNDGNLPTGIIDISVNFPDNQKIIETFYSIGNLNFSSSNESALSTEIICNCDNNLSIEIEKLENITIENIESNKWRLNKPKNTIRCSPVCNFRVYKERNPVLKLSVSIPFNGVTITDVEGNIVSNGTTISFANLTHYYIINHGNNSRIDVSYDSGRENDTYGYKHLKSNIIGGLVPLSDYSDLIIRMFNLYGENNRSSVVLTPYAANRNIYIRKFTLESTIKDDMICIDNDNTNSAYEGNIYCFPVGYDLPANDFAVTMLEHIDINKFSFPEDFSHNEVIVFSDPNDKSRIIPKYYNRHKNNEIRSSHSAKVTLHDTLQSENFITGEHWRKVCKAYDICCHYNLPFDTYNGIKPIARDPELLAKFIIAMWLNDYKDILKMDIDRFEQEMVTAIHWIPADIWEKCINELIESKCIPEPIMDQMKQSFLELRQELLYSTISTDIATSFAKYLDTGKIGQGHKFSKEDIQNYKANIRGLSDINEDLPTISIVLRGEYYPYKDRMLNSYRTMLNSAMCAAENTCIVQNFTNLFLRDNIRLARVVNFYRRYFKKTYSDIFYKTVKYIKNPR